MQGLGASTQRAERGTLTQCAEAGGIDPVRRGGVLTQRVRALTQRAGSEAPMQRAGASTQHAGARGIDAGWGDDDAGHGGVQLEHRLALGAREDGGKWNYGEVTPLVTRWSRITCVCDFQNLHSTQDSTANKPQLFLGRNA